MPKRLELLTELAPQAKVFALLVNPEEAATNAIMHRTQDAVRTKAVDLHVLKASNSYEDLDAAFAALPRLRVDGLLVSPREGVSSWNFYIIRLAERYAVPAIYGASTDAWSGGLVSYGPDLLATQRQAGGYVARILKGEKPAYLPVEQATRLDLVINLKTAKALGLTVPQSLLSLADEVIE